MIKDVRVEREKRAWFWNITEKLTYCHHTFLCMPAYTNKNKNNKKLSYVSDC